MRLHGPVSESTTNLGSCHRALVTASALAAVVLSAACGGDGTTGAAGGNGSMNPAASGNGSGSGTSTAGANSGGGAANTGTGGAAATTSGAGGVATSTSGAGGLASFAGSGVGGNGLPHPTNSDHCLYGYSPLPSDETMAAGPATYKSNGGDDTILQPEVLKWMADNKWTGAHVVWHAVRGCNDGTARGLLGPLGFPNICQDYPVLIPTDQNCKTAGDGYHSFVSPPQMQALKQLGPAAATLPFEKFPTTQRTYTMCESRPEWNQQCSPPHHGNIERSTSSPTRAPWAFGSVPAPR